MAPSRAALLIGQISHCRNEWEALSSLVNLKVSINPISARVSINEMQEYDSGSREEFFEKCKSGEYDDVEGIYRSNDSVSVTGPFDQELVQALPKSLKYITHNGAGYDNIDVTACTKRHVQVSSTPIAVNDATADSTQALSSLFLHGRY